MMNLFTLRQNLARNIFRPLTIALVAFLTAGSVQAADIVNETLRSGTIPSGWSQTGVTFTTAASGYANVSSSGVLTSPVIDLSGYTGVTLTFDVAKFGSAANGPLTVEFSDNGGSTWTAQTFTSPTPSGSTYLTSGPTSITVTGSSVRFRFRNASASGKRLRDVVLSGTIALSNTIVDFVSASSSIAENGGPVNLALAITNPDAVNATNVTISATDPNGRITSYNSTVVFPAGSSSNQNVVVNLNDNSLCDGDEDVTFTITAVTGGTPTAVAGAQDTHVLSITDNEVAVDPVATAGTALLSNGFTANWNAISGATGYFLDVSTSPTFGISSPGTSTTETFTDIDAAAPTSYNTRTWTGVDGVGWTAYKSRADQEVFTGNTAVALRDQAGSYLISDAIAGGVDAISFDVKQVFSGSGGVLTVKVLSGVGFATSTTIGTIAYDATASVFDMAFTVITGPIQILVENNTAVRAAIDNLTFTRATDFTPSFVAGYDNLNVGTNLSQAVTGLDALTTYYYRVRSTGGCSTGDNSNVIDVTTAAGAGPVLNAGTLADFGTLCVNTDGVPQSLTIDGVNLTTADVTVAALAGFSYSTTELGTYTSTLSIPQGGGTFSQDIWVMFSPTAEQNYNGDITIGGGGAADIDVVVLGNGIDIASEVNTGAASQIEDDETEAFGSLDVEGCSPTTAYGIEYSTTLGFTEGTGTQVASSNMIGAGFSSVLTGLDLCTDYYFRAYITNSQGTFYGDEETFNNTDITAPTATAATGVLLDGFTANWDAIGAATGYFLDVSTSPTFGTPYSSTTVSTGFDNGRASLPTDWSQTGLGTDYTSAGNYGVAAPSLKFDDSGDRLITPVFAGGATSLSFWYKGQGTAGGPSALLTEGFNGTSWVTIGTLTGVPSNETGTQTYPLNFNDGFVQFRFTFTKDGGNIAFDDASITYTAGSPDFLPGYDALPVAGTSEVLSGLDPSTTYYYRVRANSGCGSSLNSNTIEVTTLTPGCHDPLADNYDLGTVEDNSTCTYCVPTIEYNTPIPTPITIGTGIPADNAAVSVDCHPITVGMTAFERFGPAIIPVVNVYTTTTGYSRTSAGDPTPDPAFARWNLLGSIDLGTFDFTQVNVFLDLDFDPGATPVWNTVDVSAGMIAQSMGNQHIYQAAENLLSSYWAGLFPGIDFDPTIAGIYDVRVRLESSLTNVELLNMSIQIVVEAPEVTYYSQTSGDVSDNIWDIVPVGTAGPAIFANTANMVVQNTHTVVNTAATDVKNVTVETGGTLSLNAGTDLNVYGDEAIFDGTLVAADLSTLSLLSTEASIMEVNGAAMDLWNLTVNTPEGILVSGDISIRGTLQLDNGDFDVSFGSLTLTSTATGTGRLGPVAASASYDGVMTVQRFIPAGRTNWRMLGSPVAGKKVYHWKDDFFTAGFPGSHFPNFYDPAGSGILWPSIRYYDETVVSTNADDGVIGVTDLQQPLNMGQGFLVWSGDDLLSTSAFTVDVKGAPYIANTPITLPMSFTSSGTVEADGWNLVSNPVPSPIDFTLVNRSGDVQNAYWIFDPVAGNMKSWTSGVGQGNLNGILQSSQGFYLKANGAALTTTVSESAKVEEPLGGTFGGSQNPALPILSLTINSDVNTYSDEATIVFANGTPDYDAMDALKFTFKTVGAPQVSILSNDGRNLAVDFYGDYTTAIQIPLLVNADITGTYTISASIMGIDNLSCLSIQDLQTGSVTALTDGATYSFTINASDDANSPRFMLNGTAPMPLYFDQAACSDQDGAATVVVNDGPVNIQWTDVFGNVLLTQSNVESGVAEFTAPAGNYMIRVTPGGACGELVSNFTITAPSAIEAGTDVSSTTCPNGTDGTADVAVMGGIAPYDFLWSNGSTGETITDAAGNYTVIITDANGCTLQATVVVPAGEGTIASFEMVGTSAVANTAVDFTNTTVFGEDYIWDFGDGTTSTDVNATHTWTLPGTYTVTLTATGGDCSDVFTMELTVDATTAIEAITSNGPLAVWATQDHIVIEHSFNNSPVNVDVYDATGRLAISRGSIVNPGRILINDHSLSTGVWFVRVTSGDVQRSFRVPLIR